MLVRLWKKTPYSRGLLHVLNVTLAGSVHCVVCNKDPVVITSFLLDAIEDFSCQGVKGSMAPPLVSIFWDDNKPMDQDILVHGPT